jgi:hypothetical protein
MLSLQSIASYQALYQREFGIALTVDEATAQAERLLNMARVVLQPMPQSFLPRYHELRGQKTQNTGMGVVE